ncbi:MAG: cobaltochelatase subunit CobN, partial [Acidimicrobiia bacterium]
MILVLTNADTEILALRSIVEALPPGFPPVRAANPAALDRPPPLEGVEAVLVRLLGGRRAWERPFDDLRRRCVAGGIPLLAFGGEAVPDAELAGLSTVPAGTLAQAFAYLVHGGLDNVEHLLRFVADAVLRHGFGFDAPRPVPGEGVLDGPGGSAPSFDPSRPTVGIVFYRAHLLAGNTTFVADLAAAVEAAGANAVPVWCYSLRPDGDGRVRALELLGERGVDAVITTVLAMGSTRGDEWDAGALAALGVPVVQAVAATSSSAAWEASDAGLAPVDVAMQVAIPEFDGRIIAVPFSFKETVDDADVLGSPVTAYRTRPDRAERVAGLAVRLASLRRTPVAERRIAVVLSAYPTRRSRVGNAVALDTPASVVALLESLRRRGYRVERVPADGDALMAELLDGFAYEQDWLSETQLARAPGRWPAGRYAAWFATLPEATRRDMVAAWGEPPGSVHLDAATGELVFPGIDLGHVLVTVQPPRGFGENPIAIYHSPDLAPT